MREYHRERRRRWKAAGRCVQCGDANDQVPLVKCAECSAVEKMRGVERWRKVVVA